MFADEYPLRLSYVLATPEVSAMPLAWVGWSDKTLARVAEIGYGGAELQVRDPGSLDATDLARSLARASLVPTGVSTGPVSTQDGLFLLSPEDDVRAAATRRMIAAAELAAELGTHVTIGGVRGFRRWAPDTATAMSWFGRALDAILERAESLGVTVVLEPQSRYNTDYFNRMRDTLDFIDLQGSDALAVEADTYHMALEEDSVPGSLVLALASGRLSHVQISDSNRLAPGWGSINWQDIFAILRALRYEHWVSVEVSQIPDSESAAVQGFRLATALTTVARSDRAHGS